MADGVLETGMKAVGSAVEAMRGQPLAIANIVLNICFLLFLFYYVSRISQRAEHTVAQLFSAQDKLYDQWRDVIKDQTTLTEKAMHCILPERCAQVDSAALLCSASTYRS